MDREETLLEVPHQPARLLEVLGEEGGFAFPGLAKIVGILLIDADSRVDRRVDAHRPTLLFPAHDDIGNDCPRLEAADLGARPRVEAANQLNGRAQVIAGAVQRFQQPRVVTGCHQRQLVFDDLDGDVPAGRIDIQGLKLQRETLAETARRDSRRLQRLHDAQRRLQIFGVDIFDVSGEFEHFLQRLAQKSVLVQGVDDPVRELIVTLSEAEQQQLLPQRIA